MGWACVIALAAALALLIAIALPTLAGAATTWTVEGTGDAPLSEPGECETADEECTFRAAIEAANEHPDRDTIKFDTSFHGAGGPTIVLGSALPPITQPLRIDATPCEVGQGPPFPCVPISAPADTVGIDVEAGETDVEGLIISGAEVGIRLTGSAAGNVVEGNEIRTSLLDDDAIPIWVLNGPNEVYANVIGGTCCFPGIYLSGSANGNKIGGDTAQSENVIDGFQFGAIGMTLQETSRNEISRNRGSNHAGFILLEKANSAEAGFPNQIEPPTIDVTVQPKTGPGEPGPQLPGGPTTATGIAEPGAKVRLFSKATDDPGEIAGFIGETTADGTGKWKASLGGLPAGALVAATQTLDGGTSELSQTATAHNPPANKGPGGPGDDGGGTGTNSGGSPPSGGGSASNGGAGTSVVEPPFPPLARINSGPAGTLRGTTARFRFTSPVAGARFQCRLDGARKFGSCRSPKVYRHLTPGKHVFRLRAVGPTGTLGAAVKRVFTVS